MKRQGLVCLVLVLLTACPKDQGSSSSSSSSSGGSSSGTPTGQPIALDQLCPALAQGYVRYTMFALSGLSGGGLSAFGPGCPASAAEDLYMEAFSGDPSEARADLCSPDGGTLTALVKNVATSETAGRLTYNAQAAGQCQLLGRNMFNALGGVMALSSPANATSDAGFTQAQYQESCGSVLVGHQAPGQPCTWNAECDQSGVGAECLGKGAQATGCDGVCVRLASENEACGGAHPSCQANLTCLKPGGVSVGFCVQASVVTGATCSVDGGTFECPVGEACIAGTCRTPYGAGTGCSEANACQPGLTCAGSPPRCMAPLAADSQCAGGVQGDLPCGPCLTCTQLPVTDGGAAFCKPVALVGEPCTDKYCNVGLACVGGVCVNAPRRGEACTDPDGASEADRRAMYGNCLRGNEACVDGTCQKRPRVGQACKIPSAFAGLRVQGSCSSSSLLCLTTGGGTSGTCVEENSVGAPCSADGGGFPGSQGTCDYPATCVRPNATASDGTCAARAGAGQACGNRFDLPSSCANLDGGPEAGPIYQDCGKEPDAGVGTCYPSYGSAGDVCKSYSCNAGLYCDGMNGALGHCQPGGNVGDLCEFSQPWGTTCRGGLYCKDLGADGGYHSQCAAFEAMGSACSIYSSDACGPNGRCIQGVCAPPSGVGGACNYSSDCQPDLDCDAQNHCKTRAGSGEACMYSSDCQRAFTCNNNNICAALATRGQACQSSSDCLQELSCSDGICVDSVCQASGSIGSCDDPSWVPQFLLFGMVVGAPWVRSRRKRR